MEIKAVKQALKLNLVYFILLYKQRNYLTFHSVAVPGNFNLHIKMCYICKYKQCPAKVLLPYHNNSMKYLK